ncbi:hypothetical protein NDU88_002482 [Pleurodeles waltl]|uniref:Uncharacterized protein n=1 Tax=Pleurodeles waltl TaxID=8319 RepID=A0AAV7W458_PLEWA|nr:hypothetical protein NDU88_002482 [Pleurodeles waltl]
MREVDGTGGGPSTVPPHKAIESMVETTLEPEAVIGIGDLDSSAPGTSKSLPQVPTDDPSVQGDEDATITADEAASISAGECMTTPIVHHARETTEETDVDTGTGNLTSGPQMGVSRPLRTAGPGRRRRRQTQAAGCSQVCYLTLVKVNELLHFTEVYYRSPLTGY